MGDGRGTNGIDNQKMAPPLRHTMYVSHLTATTKLKNEYTVLLNNETVQKNSSKILRRIFEDSSILIKIFRAKS